MTNGIKIPITGDLSGLKKEVEDFGRTTSKTMDEVNKHTGGAGAAPGVGKMGADAKRAAEEVRKLQRELKELERLQKALAKAGHTVGRDEAAGLAAQFQHLIKNTGGWGKKFSKYGDLATYLTNYRDLSPNSKSSERALSEMLGQLGLGGAGAPPGEHNQNPAAPGGMRALIERSMQRAARGIGGALPGGGGGIVRDAAGAAGGMRGLMSMRGLGLLGAGGLIGGAAYGLMRGIGSVRAHMGSAEEEAAAYSDLMRRMNQPASGFNELRSSGRTAAESLALTYTEGGQLAEKYARAAGDGLSSEALGAEMTSAGKFARGLGLQPEAGIDLMGTLRHNKVTNGDSENRRFAAMLAEAIASAGVFSKADEVMAAVGQYTAVATRAQFGAANAEGYVGGMHALMGTRLAGMDPEGAASVLGKLDSGFRGPHSEAARNFILGSMQRRMGGLNALDMGALLDGGAFGTAESAFGEKSVAFRAASEKGDKALMERYRKLAKAGGTTTNIDSVLGAMRGQSTDYMRENIMGMFGMSSSEASSIITAYSKHGSLSSAVNELSGYIDPATANPGNIRAMLQARHAEPEELRKMAAGLRGMGTDQQNSALERELAKKGDDVEGLREAVLKVQAGQNYEVTEGDRARQDSKNLDNLASKMAGELIPITNEIRGAVLKIAGYFGYKPGDAEKERKAAIAEKEAAHMAKLERPMSEVWEDTKGSIRQLFGKGRKGVSAAELDSIAEAEGLSPAQRRAYKAIVGQESSNGKNAGTSIDGARGAGQIMPDTFRQYAKRGEHIDNKVDNLRVSARIVKHLGKLGGDDPLKIAAGYHSGPGNIGEGDQIMKKDKVDGYGKRTSDYVKDIEKRLGSMPPEAQIPPGAKPPQAAHTVNFKGEISLLDQHTRQPRAEPLNFGIGVPIPAGVA